MQVSPDTLNNKNNNNNNNNYFVIQPTARSPKKDVKIKVSCYRSSQNAAEQTTHAAVSF
jgi:hypothetical protein